MTLLEALKIIELERKLGRDILQQRLWRLGVDVRIPTWSKRVSKGEGFTADQLEPDGVHVKDPSPPSKEDSEPVVSRAKEVK